MAWRQFHDRLVDCCSKVWEAVKGVLCIDSPEGQEEGQEDDELDIGIKDTLSFSWRSLKEARQVHNHMKLASLSKHISSLISAVLINTNYVSADGHSDLLLSDYKMLGDLTFVQLADLRHRGAFSAVSQAFTACCRKCASLERPSHHSITSCLVRGKPPFHS